MLEYFRSACGYIAEGVKTMKSYSNRIVVDANDILQNPHAVYAPPTPEDLLLEQQEEAYGDIPLIPEEYMALNPPVISEEIITNQDDVLPTPLLEFDFTTDPTVVNAATISSRQLPHSQDNRTFVTNE